MISSNYLILNQLFNFNDLKQPFVMFYYLKFGFVMLKNKFTFLHLNDYKFKNANINY